MKKNLFLIALLSMFSVSIFAQKYAFVDTEYILSNIPSYKAAQDQLDQLSEQWQKELETKHDEVEKLYKEYQAEEVLLTKEVKQQKEDEIIKKEKEAKELQDEYFGQNGLLFQKREELIKPIQDEIYKAVKDIANESGYAVIFDTASGPTLIYTNPRYDVSDDVLRRLGYKN